MTRNLKPLLVLLWTAPAFSSIPQPVRVEGGMVIGVAEPMGGVQVFRGIPYAAPPVGDLRWRPPEPVQPWQGVRQAADFAPEAVQDETQDYNTTSFAYPESQSVSEDCLYLNIWTAADSVRDRRPVMLWIHGGGFSWGGGGRGAYDGEALSRKGVVVVTINYRLNVFGFLAHPELSRESPRGVSGNYGLLDIIAAIKWTRRNIAAFGGDPDRITIFGESAGSIAVSALVASPLVKGDFKGAIAESILFMEARKLADAEVEGARFLGATGARSIGELRALSADRLFAAYVKSDAGIKTMPVVDNWVLDGDVFSAEARGSQNNVPILTGSNSDEGSTVVGPVSAPLFIERSRQIYGAGLDRFLSLYPAVTDLEAAQSQLAGFRDRILWQHMNWAALHTRNHNRAYLYFFTHAPPLAPGSHFRNRDGGHLPGGIGARHEAEYCYAFDSLAHVKNPWRPIDAHLADVMSSYWANFAAKGDPNGDGLPMWPVYGSSREDVMELGDRVAAVSPVLSDAKARFWADEYDGNPGGIPDVYDWNTIRY